MKENEFWKLIETSGKQSQGNGDEQVKLLESALGGLPETEILDFDRLLHEQMASSCKRNLWAAAYIINRGCSDDGFDYFRAWLIAQGKETFQNALNNPEILADIPEGEVERELLLYAAVNAYEKKFDKKFPYPKRSSPQLTGDEWKEDEAHLSKLYPRLFARFWNESAEKDQVSNRMNLSDALTVLQRLTGSGGGSPTDPDALYQQAAFISLDEAPENLKKSAALLLQAAQQGHAGAQHLLGTCYHNGRGVERDYSEALKWYQLAADQNNADAFGALGMLYHNGSGVPQDHAKAFEWYRKGAEAGSDDAVYGLGVLYANGLGVKKDQQEAVKWFQQAADAGSDDAQYNLGVLYAKGRGVAQDWEKAAQLYQAAAKQGHDKAQTNLGLLYSTGKGVPQSFEKAVELHREAAQAGNLIAINNLGILYTRGNGVAQDYAEAVRLYRECADAGLARGQFNLGTMYQRGLGVPQDYAEALRWYREAAKQNLGSAQNNIGDFYENGYGVKQDYAEAAQWYHKAAENGVSVAQWSLGQFCRDGLGVKQNFDEAARWFQLAADQGLEKAKESLAALHAAGHVKVSNTPRAEAAVKGSGAPSTTPAPAKVDLPDGRTIVAPSAAASRLLCLRALFRRCEIEASSLLPDRNSHTALEKAAENINEWLKSEGLWELLSHKENAWLTLPTGKWPRQALTDAGWRAEALGTIFWALKLTEEIPPYDKQLDQKSFVNTFELPTPAQPFISTASLRPEPEILSARKTAESWLWRARTTQIRKDPAKYPPPAGWTYEKIIKMAAEHLEKERLFKRINGDFPALGKSYSELTEEQWRELRSIATERLYGLNWLCGYASDWDRVPTNT